MAHNTATGEQKQYKSLSDLSAANLWESKVKPSLTPNDTGSNLTLSINSLKSSTESFNSSTRSVNLSTKSIPERCNAGPLRLSAGNLRQGYSQRPADVERRVRPASEKSDYSLSFLSDGLTCYRGFNLTPRSSEVVSRSAHSLAHIIRFPVFSQQLNNSRAEQRLVRDTSSGSRRSAAWNCVCQACERNDNTPAVVITKPEGEESSDMLYPRSDINHNFENENTEGIVQKQSAEDSPSEADYIEGSVNYGTSDEGHESGDMLTAGSLEEQETQDTEEPQSAHDIHVNGRGSVTTIFAIEDYKMYVRIVRSSSA